VPPTAQKQTKIESSTPFPAVVVLFGDIGTVSVQTPELKVSRQTDIFSLISKASSLIIRARQLSTPMITLQNVLLRSHGGAFSFQGSVSSNALQATLLSESKLERSTNGGILLRTKNGSVVLHLLVSNHGSRVAAALTSQGKVLPPVFTILEDPHMHVSSASFQPQGEGWLVVVRGHAG
jgi:hypothetical protein